MTILISVGGLPYAEQTVRFGTLVAQILGESVMLLTVQADAVDLSGADRMLDQLAEMSAVPVVEKLVVEGTAVNEIVNVCQSGNYKMLILGTRAVHGLPLEQSGKIARKISNKVPVPLLVVKDAPTAVNHLLISTSGLAGSELVVKAGFEFARSANAKVTLLYVSDPMPQMYAGLDIMHETVAEVIASDTLVGKHLQWTQNLAASWQVEATITMRQGLVVEEILQETEANEYDLIVVGAPHHKTLWQTLTLGDISPHIIENAPASVMVVRS